MTPQEALAKIRDYIDNGGNSIQEIRELTEEPELTEQPFTSRLILMNVARDPRSPQWMRENGRTQFTLTFNRPGAVRVDVSYEGHVLAHVYDDVNCWDNEDIEPLFCFDGLLGADNTNASG